MKKQKTISIGLPITPSRWNKETKINYIVDITMSCGGGVGGSKWHEYVILNDISELKPNELITLERYNGEKVVINTSYIVMAEPNKVISKVELFHENKNFKDNYRTYYLLHDKDLKLQKTYDFDYDKTYSNNCKEIEVIDVVYETIEK